jgi:hypothetical protein
MEYFLGAIHWLDALTPPLEKHLQQLAEAVKALLQIDVAQAQRRRFVTIAAKLHPQFDTPNLPCRALEALYG